MKKAREMRDVFCDSLIKAAEEDSRVFLLDADLMGSMGTRRFMERFPARTVDCGIQEANMVGVASGMSTVGFIPFIHSFASFITRRAMDQIFVSAAYNQANVKIIGSDPGITAQKNGGTHMCFEDMGLMRSIPNMTVLEPTDLTMLKAIVPQLVKAKGVQYMRLVRKTVAPVYEEGETFTIGQAKQLTEGDDATIIASGFCVNEALIAHKMLEKEGVSTRIIDMFTWKPIDEEIIKQAVRETKAIVVCENHNVKTGLGMAVAEVVVKNRAVPMRFIGINDLFGQVGELAELAEEYGINAKAIKNAVLNVLEEEE